ncbi:hypothetical protein C5Y97_18770 [Blastopirellula marina]|uniref:Uncharacterized protein n=1 Tax=Blastopirellula marina TaxID=124 RepID=A0A2S8FH44_9BACT|nr:hypothetical protein C5Y98_18760 [Blastopirellula marina]PTL42778.1 hypothetical protein C5Y97_18770 [Blastopirellula marina]
MILKIAGRSVNGLRFLFRTFFEWLCSDFENALFSRMESISFVALRPPAATTKQEANLPYSVHSD